MPSPATYPLSPQISRFRSATVQQLLPRAAITRFFKVQQLTRVALPEMGQTTLPELNVSLLRFPPVI